jgi:hypothetical protein
MNSFLKFIKWFIDTFRVALSIILVILILLLVGCANLETLVQKEKNVSRETAIIKIGEKKWLTKDVEESPVNEVAGISVKVGELVITTVLEVV